MAKVFRYVLKYKGTLIFGNISMLIVIGVDLLIPYMQQIFIDYGIIFENVSFSYNVEMLMVLLMKIFQE